eukprot:TRINITY_DN1657_c1_g1_i1.p1 TRINITY_DN1657_c1_g1~~TRINITY_DN1657_c1_g1_i1.p1  ORF type:complete len:406 (+),score=119.44 TRINITY_DN1657_c1_g1_i1:607-1824(+)
MNESHAAKTNIMDNNLVNVLLGLLVMAFYLLVVGFFGVRQPELRVFRKKHNGQYLFSLSFCTASIPFIVIHHLMIDPTSNVSLLISASMLISFGLISLIKGTIDVVGEIPHAVADLKGAVVIVTGANAGIGFEACKQLAELGSSVVIMACRNEKKGKAALERLEKSTGKSVFELMLCDTSDLESVKSFADNFKSKFDALHALVLNAGSLPSITVSKQGYENGFATMNLGHQYLYDLLEDMLVETDDDCAIHGRVVTTSSSGNYLGFVRWNDLEGENAKRNAWEKYAQAKLINVMFTQEGQKRADEKFGQGKLIFSCHHPGYVQSDIWRSLPSAAKPIAEFIMTMVARQSDAGARGILHGVMATDIIPGRYFQDCVSVKPNPKIREEDNKKIWEMSEEYLQKFAQK